MKTSSLLCIILLIGSVGAWAQGPAGARPLLDFRKKNVDEATKAKAIEAAKTVVKQVPEGVKDKAKELLTSPETADMRQKAIQAAQALMQDPSDTLKSVVPGNTASPSVPVLEAPPPPPAGPQPKPLQPIDLNDPSKTRKGQIIITAQKSAFFDANASFGSYTGDVKVRHPQMYIECEQLELFMVKQGGALGMTKPKIGTPATQDADIVAPVKKESGTGIEKADARGPMVTVEKVSEEGELQIGHCKHLVYDGKTDITTLYDWPQVQAGNKLHQATEPSCIMIIDRTGKLTTTGGHQTIVLQGEDAMPKSRSGMAPAQPAPKQ